MQQSATAWNQTGPRLKDSASVQFNLESYLGSQNFLFSTRGSKPFTQLFH